MASEPLSEHCSLMAKPGGPPKPATLPADCPKDAAYIKSVDEGGHFAIPGYAPFPLVFEGGIGDDHVTVVGNGGRVLVRGGEGNDSMLVESGAPFLRGSFLGGNEVVVVGLVCASILIGMLIWRLARRNTSINRD